MKKLRFLTVVIIFFTISKPSLALNPTFDLFMGNVVYTNSNAGYFDIVIRHTNPGESEFKYAAGQFIIYIDSIMYNQFTFRKDSSGSGPYENRIPYDYTGSLSKGNGNELRLLNVLIPDFLRPTISPGYGTLICRIKFTYSNIYANACLGSFMHSWKYQGSFPFTEIYADVNDSVFALNNLENNNMYDYLCPTFHCCVGIPETPPQKISPLNNSTNIGFPTVFNWTKFFINASFVYEFQLAYDSLFTNVIKDTIFTSASPASLILSNLEPLSTYYWRVRASGQIFPAFGVYNEPWKFTTAPNITANIKLIPEGYYLIPSQISINVKSYLRSVSSPYSIVDSAEAFLSDPLWTGEFNFNNASTGTYYIVAKHFNTIETWSKAGGESLIRGASANNYNFTSSASQAYGNNLTQIGSAYCIYSGDVNQDGLIDLIDVVEIFNNAVAFATGYLATDVNGDNITDLSDILITNNNSANFVLKITP